MRATRPAEQALRLAVARPYVCHACLRRQFHTTPLRPAADEPWHVRLKNTIFGTEQTKQAEKSRDEKQKRRFEELAADENSGGVETKTDKHGRTYEIAALVNPSVDTTYVQATTGEGLETVGGEEWVRKRADRGERYVGFAPKARVVFEREGWAGLLHWVTVEVLALRQAGRNIEEVCWPRIGDGVPAWAQTRKAVVGVNEQGVVTVTFPSKASEEKVLGAIPREMGDQSQSQSQSQGPPAPALSGQMRRNLAESKGEGEDNAWMKTPLRDPAVKLAILKRLRQLTSTSPPDHLLSNLTTFADLHHALLKKPAPTKLTQTPQLEKLRSVEVPNVTVHNKRQTPVDKEMAVGRWKVIEEELVQRGLPIVGKGGRGMEVGL